MEVRKRSIALLLVGVLGILTITSGCSSGTGSGFITDAQAQTLGSPMVCSVATVKGTYGIIEQRTIVTTAGPPPLFPPGPGADIVIATYDGAGNFSGMATANQSGVPFSGSFSGTYSVNADCTFTAQYTAPPVPYTFQVTGIIAGQGTNQELHYIYTVPAFLVSSGTARKTPPGGCSQATLKGSYAIDEQGTVLAANPAPLFPLGPAVNSVPITFDGTGSFSGSFTGNLSGTITAGEFSGTYNVNANCTYSAQFTAPPLPYTFQLTGIITGQGVTQEVHYVYTEPTFLVSSGAAKKL